ncbi:unnamed protein product [Onchocerca ochengi]|uniref:Integrase_H2C2 domain-containing protein n=1 Tax=Onchocerca ochengi TaxID=42157 RepID=A0A182EUW4_ONCOC|nr:unnamed protein product [Onchocerca ochengi]
MAQSEVSQEDIEKWGLVRDADDLWKSLGRLRWSRAELTNFPYYILSQEDIEKWGLVRDADDLWKSLGRLRWSRAELTNFPYYICKGSIAELIVKQYHEKMFHASANLTWVKVRQTYWIPHGKTYVKSILRKLCKGCTRWNVIPFEQPEFPPYPPER